MSDYNRVLAVPRRGEQHANVPATAYERRKTSDEYPSRAGLRTDEQSSGALPCRNEESPLPRLTCATKGAGLAMQVARFLMTEVGVV